MAPLGDNLRIMNYIWCSSGYGNPKSVPYTHTPFKNKCVKMLMQIGPKFTCSISLGEICDLNFPDRFG